MRAAVLVMTALVLGCSATARAADVPRVEGFGAYSYARGLEQDLHGWSATVGYNFTPHLELETEIAAHYGSFGNGTDLGRQSLLAGPRFNVRAGRATPFVRALAGAVRTSTGITVQNVSITAHETEFGGVAGAGVDVALGRHWGLRLQGDYLMVSSEGETEGDPRAAVGISYRFGQAGTSARTSP